MTLLTTYKGNNFFSLRARFIVLTVIPLLIIIGLLTVFNITREKAETLPRLAGKGFLFLQNLSTLQNLNTLFTKKGSVHNKILDLLNKNKELKSIIFFDSRKYIIKSYANITAKKNLKNLNPDNKKKVESSPFILPQPQIILNNPDGIVRVSNYMTCFKYIGIFGNKRVFAAVQLSLDGINLKIRKILFENMVVAFIAVFLGVFTAVFLSKITLEPIKKINAGISRISEGNLEEPVQIFRHDELGKLAGFINLMSSKIKKQQEMNKLIAENEKMANLGKLAANLAHEIKNPMAIIKSMNQILLQDLQDSNENMQKISIVISEADRVTNVIDQLLNFAKMKPCTPVQINPETIVESIIATTQGLAREKQCQVRLIKSRTQGYLKDIFIDVEQLRMIIVNLLINSFGSDSTKINIHVEPDLNENPQHMVIYLKDNGSGIPEHLVNKIFEPFVTGKTRGTGLGLSISKAMMKANGGKIEYLGQGLHEKGAAFALWLPVVSGF